MDLEEETTTPTTTRGRDMLRKGALAGGGLVWLAPSVRSVAFAQSAGSPPPECVPLLIDDFSGDVQQVGAPETPPFVHASSEFGATVLGGFRDMWVHEPGAADDGNGYLRTTGIVNSSGFDRLSFSNTVGEQGALQLQYDGVDDPTIVSPTGLGGVDFLGAGRTSIVLTVYRKDIVGDLDITVTLYDGANAVPQTITLNQAVAPGTDLPISFPLVGFAPVDLTNVGAVSLDVDAKHDDMDVSFTDFSVVCI